MHSQLRAGGCRGHWPGWRVPGGTAGSLLVSHIHLAALVEATPVPAKGMQ